MKTSMKALLQKWGNSLAIRIPREAVESAKLHRGELFEISVTGFGALRIRRARRRLRLPDLVRGISKKNRYREMDWGASRGRELW